MKNYLNNAGAALMSSATISSIENHLQLESKVGPTQAAADRSDGVRAFYESVSRLVNIDDPTNIAFMDSASRAWNMALYGLPISKGDVIVTLSSEFGTNLVSLYHLANRTGAIIQVVQCDERGRFDVGEIENQLKRGARLVAISHAVAHASIVNPVEEIGRLVSATDAIYLVDGCQAVGQVAVDVNTIGCHAYTGTGRKWLRGPRGSGFLFVRPDAPISPLYVDLASADLVLSPSRSPMGVTIRADARRLELWERSVAVLLGLGTAIAECVGRDIDATSLQIQRMSNALREAVAQQQGLRLLGEVDSRSGVVGFYLKDASKEDQFKAALTAAEIQFSLMHDWDCPLHFPANGAKSIFRLSPHYYTNDSAIEAALKVITEYS